MLCFDLFEHVDGKEDNNQQTSYQDIEEQDFKKVIEVLKSKEASDVIEALIEEKYSSLQRKSNRKEPNTDQNLNFQETEMCLSLDPRDKLNDSFRNVDSGEVENIKKIPQVSSMLRNDVSQVDYGDNVYLKSAYYFGVKPCAKGNILMLFSFFLIAVQFFSLAAFCYHVGVLSPEEDWIQYALPIVMRTLNTTEILPNPEAVAAGIEPELSSFGHVLDFLPVLLVCMLVGVGVFQEMQQVELVLVLIKHFEIQKLRKYVISLHCALRFGVVVFVVSSTMMAIVGVHAADILLNGLALYCILEADDAFSHSVLTKNEQDAKESAEIWISNNQKMIMNLYCKGFGFLTTLSLFFSSLVHFDFFVAGFLENTTCTKFENCTFGEQQEMAGYVCMIAGSTLTIIHHFSWYIICRQYTESGKIILGLKEVCYRLGILFCFSSILSFYFFFIFIDSESSSHNDNWRNTLYQLKHCLDDSSKCVY